MAQLQPIAGSLTNKSSSSRKIFGAQLNSGRTEQTHLKLPNFSKKSILFKITTTMQPSGLTPRDKNDFDFNSNNLIVYIAEFLNNFFACSEFSTYHDWIDRSNPTIKLKSSKESVVLTQEVMKNKEDSIVRTESDSNLFGELKNRFLSFKKNKYLEQLEHYQKLAKGQAPKFMVISCGDSRVCPSSILGFEPGEAFVVRNVANLVPRCENGPTETNAALEFAVNAVKVENILVIGHSCCGGIRALMSMHDDVETSSFIGSWVTVGKNARISTKAAASNLAFDQQCRHCEKESINCSLMNLLSYPWIQEKVAQGVLSIHGGYYDFVDCTFEKWTLDYQEKMSRKEGEKYSIKDREFWS